MHRVDGRRAISQATWWKSSGGWYEIIKLNLSPKQRTRRRRSKIKMKLDEKVAVTVCNANLASQRPSSRGLPKMSKIITYTILMPIALFWIMSTLISCQLIVDHPKSRRHYQPQDKSYRSFQFPQHLQYHPPYTLAVSEFTREALLKEQEKFESELRNETSLPINREKQNELLRKLSSTMLLETLLRHPLPTNKAPFPTLPIPKILNADSPKFIVKPKHRNSTLNHLRPQKPKRFETDRSKTQIQSAAASIKDVATANLTTSNEYDLDPKSSHEKISELPYNTSLKRPTEIFDPSALNYLVDKLLRSGSNDPVQKRPTRPTISDNVRNPLADIYDTGQYPKGQEKPIITLDMLIKDEYDSRIKPMVKTLMEQQKLSSQPARGSQATSTSLVPTNHKLEESETVTDSSTSSTTFNPRNAGDNLLLSPSTTSTTQAPPTLKDGNILISFEDLDDAEEFEEDDYIDNQAERDIQNLANNTKAMKFTTKPYRYKPTSAKTSTRKVLQNVPPYQLNDSSIVSHSNQSSFRPIQPALFSDTVTSESVRSKNPSDKTADASIRGSLVFSDGADEAERARLERKRAQMNLRNSLRNSYGTRNSAKFGLEADTATQIPPTVATTEPAQTSIDRTDSFLLNQLLSTVDPLSDLNHKLRAKSSSHSGLPFNLPHNPHLMYKGYVGKDDYLFSSTARDWSKPISHREASSSTNAVRNLYQPHLPTTTTPSPSTEPPSVPYNYFLNLPVTNAQSVPSMVIPTSGPFLEMTTQPPLLTNYTEISHSKNVLQQPYLGSSQHHQHHQRPNLVPIQSNNRSYSYQIPDRPVKNFGQTNRANEINRNDSVPNAKPSSSWLPTKMQAGGELSPPTKRRHHGSDSSSANSTGTNQLIPISSANNGISLVSLNKAKVSITREQQAIDENGSAENDPPILTATNDNPSDTRKQHNSQPNSSNKRFHVQRNKSRVSNSSVSELDPGDSSGTDGPGKLGANLDTNDYAMQQQAKRTKKKQYSKEPFESESLDGAGDEDEDDAAAAANQSDEPDSYQTDDNATGSRKKVANKKRPKDSRVRLMAGANANNQQQAKQATNQTDRVLITHEPAESEILLNGLDKNLEFPDGRKKNMTTSRFITHSHKPQSKVSETILIDASGNGGSGAVSSSAQPTPPADRSSVPTSFGSTIIPSSNFFGEASSESPTLDNSIPMINQSGKINSGGTKQLSPDDLYQPTLAPKLSTLATTAQTTETSLSTSASGPGPAKTGSSSSKGTSDRLAFILIGGSCALSVVCLVLAAMSMRCSDMCDDYRSLRNAERAALKLEKHRLKYTKNHQINRYNRQSADIGQSLIEDLNGNSQNSASESEMRNSKCLGGGNSNLLNQSQEPIWSHSSPNKLHQQPALSYGNKEPSGCRCGNCISHRWLCHDDLMAANKQHLSWFSPHYYMQHHSSRLRPLFGAGSSVGTFFPRRVDNPPYQVNQMAGDPLIDDDHVQVTKTKSILHNNKLKRAQSRLAEPICDSGFCANPEHHQHACHHLHHMDPASASDESELTLDGEPGLCCDGARCPNNHHNQGQPRVRLQQQQRPSGSSSHHTSSAWRLGSIRKAQQHGHHVHHHHHHQQQQASSSDTSSIVQCTCSREHQPLISSRQLRASHKHSKPDSRSSFKHQTKRDKSMLIWSTNRDRLI